MSDRELKFPEACVTTPQGRPCAYPDTAILTRAEVAAVLDVDEKTVKRYGIKTCPMSSREVRYLYADVVQFLRSRAA